MCEVLERKDRKTALPYEFDADKTDEEIVEGLVEISAISLSSTLEVEPAYGCQVLTYAKVLSINILQLSLYKFRYL